MEIVSINSPSGEGGGESKINSLCLQLSKVSINSPSGEGGGSMGEQMAAYMQDVSINSPSGEGGGYRNVLSSRG